ncbi:DUF6458 family protein [Actinomadura sp. SCN-SB]|uniref:DUF6458 family protein n=1 Tax=Actinomadura sp. SCN-SB TaxID=3373092 RepID=UPI003752618F
MGIGVSLSFITIGAILAFALHVDLSGVNIQLVGWIFILVGLISMGFTLKYTRPRRRATMMAGTDPGYVEAEEPTGPDTLVREERIVERSVDRPSEHVERVIERPVPQPPANGHSQPTSTHPAQDPAHAQDPSFAQDPAQENLTARRRLRRRSSFRR